MLRNHLGAGESAPDASQLRISAVRLSYIDAEGKPCAALEHAFQAHQAVRFRTPLRVVTVLFLLLNIALVAYDNQRFLQPPVAACRDASAFFWALIIRLCILVPTCLLVLVFTATPCYRRSSQPLALAVAILGGCLIAYSIMGRDPGYGTLALLIVFLFSFTPVHFWLSASLCVLLLVSFGVGIFYTPDLPAGCVPSDQSDLYPAVTSKQSVEFNVIGVLVVFTLVVGTLGHSVETDLRRSFLDEYRLQVCARGGGGRGGDEPSPPPPHPRVTHVRACSCAPAAGPVRPHTPAPPPHTFVG